MGGSGRRFPWPAPSRGGHASARHSSHVNSFVIQGSFVSVTGLSRGSFALGRAPSAAALDEIGRAHV